MFDELIRRYDACIEAQKTEPYPRDLVQGLGMHFAVEWNRLGKEITEFLGFDFDKDFSYNKYRLWMQMLKEKLSA